MLTPRHIAIIMDGNGRWAQARGRPRVFGHVRGSARIKPVVREASRLGVQALTLFAFSTENWGRPSDELAALWKLMRRYLGREVTHLKAENVRLRVIGDLARLAPELRELVERAVDDLRDCTGLQLTFALSYGGRAELVSAARDLARAAVDGRIAPEAIDERALAEALWTAPLGGLADVDLLIRTSGERRISNFLLWQLAYAEMQFIEAAWPDFTPAHLAECIRDYSQRDRRYGLVAPAPREAACS